MNTDELKAPNLKMNSEGELFFNTKDLEKLNLWEEDIITIVIVLGLRFYDFIKKEWEELVILRTYSKNKTLVIEDD